MSPYGVRHLIVGWPCSGSWLRGSASTRLRRHYGMRATDGYEETQGMPSWRSF
jgi:hypothetical protein